MKKFSKWIITMLPVILVFLLPIIAFAAEGDPPADGGTGGLNFNNSIGPSGINHVAVGIGAACSYLGVAIIAFAAIQMAFAFRSDEADGKVKAMRAGLAGALVVALGAVLSGAPIAEDTTTNGFLITGFELQDKTGLSFLLTLVGQGCVYIGPAIIVFAAIQVAFAFRSDDADGKVKGFRYAVAGVLVGTIGNVLTTAIEGNTISDTGFVLSTLFAPDSALETGLADSIITLVGSGLTYLGSAIILFGAIQFAYAFRSDDADGKTKGIRNAVAGALILTLGKITGTSMGDSTLWPQNMNTGTLPAVITLFGNACVWAGGAMVLFGALQLVYAFRSDEAEPKVKGMRNAIAGVLVCALGMVASMFVQ